VPQILSVEICGMFFYNKDAVDTGGCPGDLSGISERGDKIENMRKKRAQK
jgi:hypothetical protein